MQKEEINQAFALAITLGQSYLGNVPNVDERTIHILQKYFLLSLYIVLFGSGATLLIVYAMGIKYIETGLLILCLLGLYLIIGLGALVAKRI